VSRITNRVTAIAAGREGAEGKKKHGWPNALRGKRRQSPPSSRSNHQCQHILIVPRRHVDDSPSVRASSSLRCSPRGMRARCGAGARRVTVMRCRLKHRPLESRLFEPLHGCRHWHRPRTQQDGHPSAEEPAQSYGRGSAERLCESIATFVDRVVRVPARVAASPIAASVPMSGPARHHQTPMWGRTPLEVLRRCDLDSSFLSQRRPKVRVSEPPLRKSSLGGPSLRLHRLRPSPERPAGVNE
jgi:hypothetical protein